MNAKIKNVVIRTIAILIIGMSGVSCCEDDSDSGTKTGTLKVEFENNFAGEEIEFGNTAFATSQNEVLNISNVKYIVSNIVLTKKDGTRYTYPKGQSYFIVSGTDESSVVLTLSKIPIGDYKVIKFGVGVDQAQYDLGENARGSLWTTAQAAGMTYDWSAGYKFIFFEGSYTSPTVTTREGFMVELCKTYGNYNYKDISLPLPTNASVGGHVTPQIHMSVDLSQIIDGASKINLTDHSGMIMGGTESDKISSNLVDMFTVEHVHSD